MAADPALIDWVEEAMAPIGRVTSKRLFGGAALYCDGVTFAIVGFDALWFKADADSAPAWDAIHAERFEVTRKDGRRAALPYPRAPDDVYDDADELRRWGVLALEAGRRAPAPGRKRAARPKPRRP